MGLLVMCFFPFLMLLGALKCAIHEAIKRSNWRQKPEGHPWRKECSIEREMAIALGTVTVVVGAGIIIVAVYV